MPPRAKRAVILIKPFLYYHNINDALLASAMPDKDFVKAKAKLLIFAENMTRTPLKLETKTLIFISNFSYSTSDPVNCVTVVWNDSFTTITFSSFTKTIDPRNRNS